MYSDVMDGALTLIALLVLAIYTGVIVAATIMASGKERSATQNQQYSEVWRFHIERSHHALILDAWGNGLNRSRFTSTGIFSGV